MFTIKLVKYTLDQSATECESLYETESVHLDLCNGRQVLRLSGVGDFPIGEGGYSVAYVMNSSGKTIETIK